MVMTSRPFRRTVVLSIEDSFFGSSSFDGRQ
jgi:hypothetical protein